MHIFNASGFIHTTRLSTACALSRVRNWMNESFDAILTLDIVMGDNMAAAALADKFATNIAKNMMLDVVAGVITACVKKKSASG